MEVRRKCLAFVTKQTNWKMRHPFYGLVCKFSHLFIRFKSFILFGSLFMYRSVSEKFFAQFRMKTRELFSRTTSLSSASFILSLTHRYLLYIRHSNFSHSFSFHLVGWLYSFLFFFFVKSIKLIQQTNLFFPFVCSSHLNGYCCSNKTASMHVSLCVCVIVIQKLCKLE